MLKRFLQKQEVKMGDLIQVGQVSPHWRDFVSMVVKLPDCQRRYKTHCRRSFTGILAVWIVAVL